MGVSFGLYLAYQGMALGLCLWAAMTAVPRVAEHGLTHRAWTLLAGLGAPLALIAASFAPILGYPDARPIGALLPILVIAATWSNTMSLRDQGVGLKALNAPIVAWNLSLAAVYAARVAHDLTGTDLGTPGAALVAGHALLQTKVGAADAMARPLFLHLPICLPLCLRYRWPQRLAIWAAAMVACAMLWGLVTAMPSAQTRVQELRDTGPGQVEGRVSIGVAVRMAGSPIELEARASRRDTWLGLGAEKLAFDVDSSLFEDTARLDRVREEIDFARREDREVIAFVRPDRALRRRPASSLEEFGNQIARTQWLCAEQLDPDVLVLYAGPYGRLLNYRTEVGTIEAWMQRIERDARDVRRANADVRLAAVIESRTAHASRLFDRLCADDSPVDTVGLSIDADLCTPRDFGTTLEIWSSWLADAPGTRRVWIVDSGISSLTGGGEIGQWNVIGALLSLASRQSRVEALIIDELIDDGSGRGLVTPDARSRLAYRRLRDHALLSAPRPPK